MPRIKLKCCFFYKHKGPKLVHHPVCLKQWKQLTLNQSAALWNIAAPKSQQNDQLAHPLLPKLNETLNRHLNLSMIILQEVQNSATEYCNKEAQNVSLCLDWEEGIT